MDGCPLALGLIGPPDSDRRLLAFAEAFAGQADAMPPEPYSLESYQRSLIFTHLTAFLCPLVRRSSRPGANPPQAGRNAASGQRNTVKCAIINDLWY